MLSVISQTTTSLFNVFCPHSHVFLEISYKVTHPKTTPSQTHLIVDMKWATEKKMCVFLQPCSLMPKWHHDPSHSDVILFV
jgi:hypothetical protein